MIRHAIIICSIVLIIFSCNRNTAPHDSTSTFFSEMWKEDTCGIKGFRALMVKYIDENKHSFFMDKSEKDILLHLGVPDERVTNETIGIINYWYNCSAIEINDDFSCGQAIDVSYTLQFDMKTRKVIDVVLALH